MGEWAKLAIEGVIALASTYLALTMRAFRAEMRLEIRRAIDALSDVYVTRRECELQHRAVDVRLERP